MTTGAPPSRNPANDDTLTGAMNVVLRKFLQGVDDMLPARVISHDRTRNRVQVQPLISVVDTDNNSMSRKSVASVPVLNIGGGGFFVNFSLPAGSLGWIKASDRDISLFLQSYREARPNSRRFHRFSDALFIPDVMTGYTIDDEDSGAMVIQNLDGSVRISLNDSRIKITSPQVEIDSSDVQITGASLTHNGVNIGDTHTHAQGPDSDGNTEQNTEVPQ